jgi:hypothetical protein
MEWLQLNWDTIYALIGVIVGGILGLSQPKKK